MPETPPIPPPPQASRPRAVTWAAWSFGFTWFLGLHWLVGINGLVRLVGGAAMPIVLPVVAGGLSFVAYGLVRGWLVAWAAAVNLMLLPLVLLAGWAASLDGVGLLSGGLPVMMPADAPSAALALLTLVLLLRPGSRRWFARSSALRSRGRRRPGARPVGWRNAPPCGVPPARASSFGMDDAPAVSDPMLLPDELRRPLVEGVIAAGRPAAVALAAWSFGLTWILGVVAWGPRMAGVGGLVRMLGDALSVCLATVVIVLMVGIQFGLLRGRLGAWAAAVNLSAAPILLLGSWVLSLATTGSTPLEILGLVALEAVAAAAALFTLVLLLRPASRRWFWRASALRSRARSNPHPREADETPMRRRNALTLALGFLAAGGLARARAEEPKFHVEAVFPAEKKHNHASCVVELPDGTLFIAWYRGTGERTADDVEIYAARKAKGEAKWGERFLLADTPGYPDCNPALFAAPDNTLWMWRPVILDHRWEGALLKFSVAKGPDYPAPGKPVSWAREGVHHVTPVGFDTAMAAALKTLKGMTLKLDESFFDKIDERSKDLLYQRLGWMPRVRAIALPSGRWLLPLYCDTFSASIVSYSDDQGTTWKTSTPIIGFGAIQPSLVRKSDGTIVAYMRDNGPFRKIRTCTSADEGATWSAVTSTDLPNPGAGIEAFALASGKWAMIYNDKTDGRYSLALSLSDDEGKTWKWTRHVAVDPNKKESFHYPSLMQAKDGTIHVTYTHGNLPEGSRMDHAAFNEAWVMAGDEAGAAPAAR